MWVRYRLSIVLAYCEILDGATLMQLPAVSAPLLRPLGVYLICNCKCNCNSNTQPQTKAHRYSRRRRTEGSFHFHFHFAIGLIHEPNLISIRQEYIPSYSLSQCFCISMDRKSPKSKCTNQKPMDANNKGEYEAKNQNEWRKFKQFSESCQKPFSSDQHTHSQKKWRKFQGREVKRAERNEWTSEKQIKLKFSHFHN